MEVVVQWHMTHMTHEICTIMTEMTEMTELTETIMTENPKRVKQKTVYLNVQLV